MTQQDSGQNPKYNNVNPNSKFFKLFLAYDIFMVFIIVRRFKSQMQHICS